MDPDEAIRESRWSPVAEDVFSPAAAASGERRVALFLRSADGELLVRERDGLTWSPLRSLGVPTARAEGSSALVPVEWPINACNTDDGEVHLLARGPEGELVHGRYRGPDWLGFEVVGVPEPGGHEDALPMGLASAPAACSRERGRLDVFAVDGDSNLLHAFWDVTGFSDCAALGTAFGAISAFNAGARRMGVVARAKSGYLHVKWWDGTIWAPFTPLHSPEQVDPLDPALASTSPLSSPPAACGGGRARADVFARGPRGDLLHSFWNGRDWSAFESLGMAPGEVSFSGAAAACTWGKYRLDVFACAADGKLYNATWR
jgi:hypothetical protein